VKIAVFKEGGTLDVDNETLITAVLIEAGSAVYSLSSRVGRGSSTKDFFRHFF